MDTKNLTVLRTKRLTLAPCSPHDAPDFKDLERDPEVMRYLNGGHTIDHDNYEPDGTFLMPRGTEPHVWTARHSDNNGFAGWFCLWPDGTRIAELGYRLRRADWGQGLASEGAGALVDWGFESGLYDMIFASTMAVNSGSRRVMEKIGMTYARTIHTVWTDPIPGSADGEVIYELTKPEWTSRQT